MFRGLVEGTGGTESEVATMFGWTGCGKSGGWCPDAARARAPLPYRKVHMGQLRTGGIVTFLLVSLVEWLLQEINMECTIKENSPWYDLGRERWDVKFVW